MTGMDRTTGAEISAFDDLRQSINDILSTPLGSRVARRDYGSRLFSLVDAPANAANRVLLFAACATAILRWEPRITLTRVSVVPSDAVEGAWLVTLTGNIVDAPTAQSFRLSFTTGSAL